MGACYDNSTMIFLFTDNSWLTRHQLNTFTCRGPVFFRVSEAALASRAIKKIRITNGRTFDSYTTNVLGKIDSLHFQRILTALQHYVIPKRCQVGH